MKEKNTKLVKRLASQLGFQYCGIARAVYLQDDAMRLEQWLHQGMQGTMSYMEKNFDLRVDPCKLVPGAKSVITLLLNYFPNEKQSAGSGPQDSGSGKEDMPKISKYAYGKDYH